MQPNHSPVNRLSPAVPIAASARPVNSIPSVRLLRAPLAILLAFAGLNSRAQETKPPAGDTVVLAPFSVVSDSSKGYSSTTVTGATRTNTRLEDLPQTITVINDVFLKDIAAFDLDDALAYAPSVKARSWDDDGTFVSRGFSTDSAPTLSAPAYSYKNGVRLPIGYTPDFVNIDRIEVVKGPAAAIAGRGSPGGLINYVTKRPVFGVTNASASVTVGSDNFKRGQVDVNTPLSPDSKTSAARLLVQSTDSDYWREGGFIKTFSVMPSVRAKLNDKVEVIIEAEYNQSKKPNDFGMPYNTLDHVWAPFSYTNSEPYAVRDEKLYGLWGTVTVQATDWLVLRQIFSAVDRDANRKWVWSDSINRAAAGDGSGFQPGEIYFKRHLEDMKYNNRGVNAQGDAVLTFKLPALRMSSQTLISYEWMKAKYSVVQYNYSLTNLSLTNPIYGIPPTNPVFVTNRSEALDILGVMISEQAGFFDDRVILSGGVRRDESDGIERLDRSTNARTHDPKSTVTHPRYGIVVKPLRHLSLYGVYSKSADPAASVYHFPSIAPTDPRQSLLSLNSRTELKEAGVKSEFLNGDLTSTLAFFKIDRYGGSYTTSFGPAQNDPATAGLNETIISPADQTKGVELEVSAMVSKKLRLYASYQRIQSKRLLNGVLVEFRGLPFWTASLFANYDFRADSKTGFQVRAGTVLQADQWGDNANTYKVGSDPRFDAGVSYTLPHWTFSLNVNNITNAIVPASFAAFRANSVLPPRQIRLSIEKAW